MDNHCPIPSRTSARWWAVSLLLVLPLLPGCGDPNGTFQWVLQEFVAPTNTPDPWAPPSQYRQAHESAEVIIDLHADTLFHPDEGSAPFERLLSNPDEDGHVDVPRLIEGNVTLQVFAADSKISADLAGSEDSSFTGECDYGPDPETCSRANYQRDPNVAAYDDPSAPYAQQYDPWGLRRDLMTYAARLTEMPCRTWYGEQSWDGSLWGPTAPCADYDPERMYLERLLVQAERLNAAAAIDARLQVVRSVADFDALRAQRATNPNLVGGLLATEGLYFRSDVSTSAGLTRLHGYFDELFDAGFRMFGLTHGLDNDHGGSSTGMGNASHAEGHPLSAAGWVFANRAFQRGAVVDLAHASQATFDDLIALANYHQKPVLVSHTGVRGAFAGNTTCDNPRNLNDAQVLDVARTGGVIGIGFGELFNCDISPENFAQAVRYTVDVINQAQQRRWGSPSQPLLEGIDHVALGSDYDGGIEAYTDVDDLEQYTEALMCERSWWRPDCLQRPFTEQEAHKILGANALRVLQENLPAH